MSSEMVTLWAFISPGHFLLCNLLLEGWTESFFLLWASLRGTVRYTASEYEEVTKLQGSRRRHRNRIRSDQI